MRLSEAIRLGAMLRPQCFGEFFDNGGSCAWGAAYEAALGVKSVDEMNERISVDEDPFAWADELVVHSCPGCGLAILSLTAVIIHLSDFHRWTRERIAAHVEQKEREREAVLSSEISAEPCEVA